MFDKLKKGYEECWKAIIRPPRHEYTESELGSKIFFMGNVCIRRVDIDLKNKRGMTLKCSWYAPLGINYALPCIIYLHGNSSSRLEGTNHMEMI